MSCRKSHQKCRKLLRTLGCTLTTSTAPLVLLPSTRFCHKEKFGLAGSADFFSVILTLSVIVLHLHHSKLLHTTKVLGAVLDVFNDAFQSRMWTATLKRRSNAVTAALYSVRCHGAELTVRACSTNQQDPLRIAKRLHKAG